MFERGTQIAYIPTHANKRIKHPDVEFGFVMTLSNNPGYVFCRYWRKGQPGILRTVANSESTPIENLVEYNSVSQKEVEETIEMILKEQENG